MRTPQIPEEEPLRLNALRDLKLLDTLPEERFDRLTRLARQLFSVPIALVSLVDEQRQWFKSRQGLDVCETAREISFCGHAILKNEILYVPNALEDYRFSDNPLVVGPLGIRFYAGAPLFAPDGYRVGTLCVIDTKPREITGAQLNALRDLADTVQDELARAHLQQVLQKLVDQEAYLGTVLDTVNEGILAVDEHGIIQTLNPATTAIFGYSFEELVGRSVNDLIPDDSVRQHDNYKQKFLNIGDANIIGVKREVTAMRKDGGHLLIELEINQMQRGDRRDFVAIVRDITGRRKTETEDRRYTQALEKLHTITTDVNSDLKGKINALLLLGIEVFGLTRGVVSRISGNGFIVEYASGPGAPSTGTTYPLQDAYCADTVRAGRPRGFHSNNILDKPPNIGHSPMEPQAYLATPLYVGNQCYGTLSFSSKEPRETAFTDRYFSLIKLLAQWIGNKLEQQKILDKLFEATGLRQAILDSANFSIISTDVDGTIKTFNKGAQDMLGYSEPEVVDKLTPAVIHAKDEVVKQARLLSRELGRHIEPGFEVFVARAREGRVDENEWTYIRKDGSRFPVMLSVTALRNEAGEITGFLGIGSNITERKQAQLALQKERQRLAGIIEGTHVGTWEWNVQTGETVFNERWAEIVGYRLEELSPISIQTWLELANPEDLKQSGVLLEKHFSGELPYYDCECRMRHKDGHWVWVHDRGRVVSWTDDGRPLLVSGTHADITARKLADEALRASEQKLLSLYQMAPVAIALNRFSDGQFIEGNPQLYRMTGYSEDEFHKLSYWDITPQEYADQETQQLESLRTRGTYGPYEKEYIHKRGYRFPVLLNGTLITGLDGETYIWSIVQDISERVRAERALQERERYTRTILDNVVDGIVTLDECGAIESFNASAEAMFGYKATHVVGKYLAALMPSLRENNSSESNIAFIKSCLADHNSLNKEYQGLRSNGEHFPMEFLVSEVSYGGVNKFVAVVRDITERKKIDRLKNEFVSTVSHELRTPLTSIKGALSLLLSKSGSEFSPKTLNMLHTASRNSERLTLLINDILDLEKIESGRMEFEFKAVDLVRLARTALASNETYAQNNQVRLRLTLHINDAVVWADENRLQQVFANLMSNAIKYSPAGDEVEISISLHENRYRVCVRDNGSGVPAEFRDRIFQRFAQADSSDTRERGGTGLGLSITKAIIERHTGVIDYSSEEGAGSEFYFELPKYIGDGRSRDSEDSVYERKAAS